ncbi:MAG TPA: hypothetical protein VII53_09230 [Solirubrobacteraceae bacterium]
MLLILAALVGAALSLVYAAVWPEGASANVGFGVTPGSVTARTCAAAEVTCTASSVVETQAGAHPTGTVSFALNSETVSPQPRFTVGTIPIGRVKDVVVQLPPGFVGNPQAVPQCSNETLKSGSGCPRDTMVGYAVIATALEGLQSPESPDGTLVTPVFNLVPAPGQTAQFGFIIAEAVADLVGSVRTDGDYGVSVASNNIVGDDIKEVTTTFWGVPAEHNGPGAIKVTGAGGTGTVGGAGAGPRTPFLTNPSNCSSGPLTTRVNADSWEDPGTLLTDGEANLEDPAWHTETGSSPQPTGCEKLPFGPSLTVRPDTSNADTPAGLTVEVNPLLGALTAPKGIASSDIKDTTVTLPEGLVINPGQAAGLVACQSYQDGVGTDSAPSCPLASKVGEDEIETPLLSHALKGDVYVLQSNPPNLQLLLAASGDGMNLKQILHTELCRKAGEVIDETSCATAGQLITRVSEIPQLPFSSFKLSFSGGGQAALATPTGCRTYTTTSDFTPWASPFVSDLFPTSAFVITDGTDGAPCASTPLPFSPSLIAGSTTDQAGGYTDFSLLLQAPDDQQRIHSLQFKVPEGLSGMLSRVPLCPEPQAESGTCSEASRIGHATVASGPGPYPLVVPQPGEPPANIYLTGPYDGAPFGLSIATPVIAGPFNLGLNVVRAKIEVNPLTAAITVTTDPSGEHAIPSILDGVPTDLRTINTVIDRPEFMFNPTNCNPQEFSGSATGTQGATVPIASHFQVGSCRGLEFAPRFSVSTSGKTSKANGANLTAKVAYPDAAQGTQADIAAVKVDLPKQLPSRLTTLQKACTAAQFEANPAGCPAASEIGHASVHTPELPVALEGPAIFVSHGGEAFPSLTMLLQGDGVTIDLVGSTFISKAGVTTTTFKAVPDAPFSTFELTLPQGPYSALAANGDLCDQKLVMPSVMTGQNGAVVSQNYRVEVEGCPGSLSVVSSRVKKRTLILSVYAPGAGKVTAAGKGVSSGTKAYTGREALTFTLNQKKSGKLATKIKLTFTPSKGKKQTKTLKATFKQ